MLGQGGILQQQPTSGRVYIGITIVPDDFHTSRSICSTTLSADLLASFVTVEQRGDDEVAGRNITNQSFSRKNITLHVRPGRSGASLLMAGGGGGTVDISIKNTLNIQMWHNTQWKHSQDTVSSPNHVELCTNLPLNKGHLSIYRTASWVPMVSSKERFHCIQDSQLGPNGVLYREVPLYTGQPVGSQWCPLKRGSTVYRTASWVPMVSSIKRFHCIQDSQLGPNGVL